jgi:diadenosine tetraphosphate (Ap4A) HIT family hydrolase
METCSLCAPTLAPKIVESEYWKLILNHNQRFLGACFWGLRRHLESITDLTAAEWMDLQPQVIRTTQALVANFQPDHFNYLFLQNQDRHVHMHIYPRYAQPRTLIGITFEDPDYPSHYSVPAPSHLLMPSEYEVIAQQLRGAMKG